MNKLLEVVSAKIYLGSQSSFNLNLLKGKESNVCTYLLLLNRLSFFIDLLRINNFLCEK